MVVLEYVFHLDSYDTVVRPLVYYLPIRLYGYVYIFSQVYWV